jgi:hypothetical protein
MVEVFRLPASIPANRDRVVAALHGPIVLHKISAGGTWNRPVWAIPRR